MYSQQIKERVLELHEEGVSVKEIQSVIKKETKTQLSERTVYKRVNSKEEKEFVDDANESIPDVRNYDYDDTHYIFIKTAEDPKTGEKVKKRFRVPISLVDNIFLYYSSYGKNCSKQQIIDKFGIKDEVFILLHNRLGLTKYSNAKSPISIERAEKNGTLDEELEDFSHEIIKDKYKDKLIKTHEKEFKKIAIKAMGANMNFEYYINLIKDAVSKYDSKYIDLKPVKTKTSGEKVVAFGDMHVGRTTESLENRVRVMLHQLSTCSEGTITLINMGDNWEGVMMGSQIMHDQMQMEMDHIGRQQVIKSLEIIEGLITGLVKAGKKVNYHGIVHSNHDRINKSNDADPEHILALAFNEMLRRSVGHLCTRFDYHRERVCNFIDSSINFIFSHGDLGFDKKTTEQILQMYGVSGIHNVCLSGHIHQAKLEEGTRYTRVSVPSMNGGNSYSKEIIIAETAPGYVEIVPNTFGTADVLFRRL